MLAETTTRAGQPAGDGIRHLADGRHEPDPSAVPVSHAADPLAPVTVVIVNHNADGLLIDCLDSALSQASEVVLVDNASQPEPFERLIARFDSDSRLQVIRSAENRGFAAGCNLGAELSTQPYLLFLNPDCILIAGSLNRLCAAIQDHPGTALAGGLLTYANGREQGGGRRAVPTPWRSFVRAFGLARLSKRWPKLFNDFHLHQQPLPQAPIAVEAISGACMLVSRQAVHDFGLMDEGYFLHCEDLDLCMRARQHGWQILFVPDARIVHHKGGCSRERPVFVEWHKHRGMIRFYQKHFRHQYPAGLMGLVVAGVGLRFAAVAAWIQCRRLWARALQLTAAPRSVPAGSMTAESRPLPLDGAVMPIAVSSRPVTS
jgi:GT2 family glycosyltransferase